MTWKVSPSEVQVLLPSAEAPEKEKRFCSQSLWKTEGQWPEGTASDGGGE